jgi:hypothetical protein
MRTTPAQISREEATRLSWAYGREVPLSGYGERWTLDTWVQLYARLETEHFVVVLDPLSPGFAEQRAVWVRKHLDPEHYLVKVERGTQVVVHHRATYEAAMSRTGCEWRVRLPLRDWVDREEAADMLGLVHWRAVRAYVWPHNVTRTRISEHGQVVYWRADIEELSRRRFGLVRGGAYKEPRIYIPQPKKVNR